MWYNVRQRRVEKCIYAGYFGKAYCVGERLQEDGSGNAITLALQWQCSQGAAQELVSAGGTHTLAAVSDAATLLKIPCTS